MPVVSLRLFISILTTVAYARVNVYRTHMIVAFKLKFVGADAPPAHPSAAYGLYA